MRPYIAASFVLCISLTVAWPWPPSVRKNDDLMQRRQNNAQGMKNCIYLGNHDKLILRRLDFTTTSASPSPADTSLVFDSNASSATASNTASNAASITGTLQPSAEASTTAVSGSSNNGPKPSDSSTRGQSGSNATLAPETTSIDPRLPAGGVEMLTPSAVAQPSYYKVGDQITFGWNYTSLVVTPTAVDILVSCAANDATYTLSTNASVKETGSVVWDTKADESGTTPLLTDTYTLIIHDAAQAVTAVGKSGYLGTFNSFTFGMYLPQPYTPLPAPGMFSA